MGIIRISAKTIEVLIASALSILALGAVVSSARASAETPTTETSVHHTTNATISSFQLVLNNSHGGTSIVNANLSYNTPSGETSRSISVSGDLVATIGAIPPYATNLRLDLAFKGISDEHKSFGWDTPLGWHDGTRHVDLYGRWPGKPKAVDAEA